MSVLNINNKSDLSKRETNYGYLSKCYKPNSKEMFIIIVCQPFSPSQSISEIDRSVYDGKEWNRSFVQMCPIVRLLRKSGIAVSLAPNDGKSIEYHFDNCSLSYIPLIVVAYVDERNKITLRFSFYYSNLSKSVENLLLNDKDFKRRITIQYPNNIKNGKH